MSNAKERGKALRADIVRGRDVSAIAFVIMAENDMVDDITILENGDMFVEWDEYFRTEKRNVIVWELVGSEKRFFRNIHPIQDGTQNIRPSTDSSKTMWTPIGNPAEEWPEWVQPLGSHDAYMAGAKVSHNGKHWNNTHGDYNTWEPGVWGWTQAT